MRPEIIAGWAIGDFTGEGGMRLVRTGNDPAHRGYRAPLQIMHIILRATHGGNREIFRSNLGVFYFRKRVHEVFQVTSLALTDMIGFGGGESDARNNARRAA